MSGNREVLIVGAGPTGLVMAHELARAGTPCRIIDKSAHASTHSKAIAIHARTLEAFEMMGIVDDFMAAGKEIAAVDLDGESKPMAHIGFGGLDTRYPFVLAVPQDQTERLLEERLARQGVRVERSTELVGLAPHDGGVRVQLRIGERVEEVDAPWLIGCDGPHSTVREKLGIGFAGSTYPELFVLADIKLRADFADTAARVLLHEKGALAFFPMPEDRWRLIVTNSPAGWREEPSLAQVQALVDERAPGGIVLSDPRWISVFRIHRREAARFRQGRVFVAGDAAHIHSPVGGQGMNAGIRDAFNLGWKLGLVAANLAAPELLDSYEAERKPVDEAVIRQTDRATRLISMHSSVGRFLRDHAMSLLTRLPLVEAKIGEAVSGIAVDYRGSPIVADHPVGTLGPHAGDRAPDAPLAAAGSGAALRLYDLFAEHRHVLLLLGDVPALNPDQLPGLPERHLTMRRIAAAGTSGADLIDSDGVVASRYGSAPAAYLIRPDGYVGMRCPADEASIRLAHHMATLRWSQAAAEAR